MVYCIRVSRTAQKAAQIRVGIMDSIYNAGITQVSAEFANSVIVAVGLLLVVVVLLISPIRGAAVEPAR